MSDLGNRPLSTGKAQVCSPTLDPMTQATLRRVLQLVTDVVMEAERPKWRYSPQSRASRKAAS